MGDVGAQILVVDDEENICRMVSRYLKREGFKVLVAHDGEKALNMVSQERPDLLLLDIRMPGISGMDVLRRVKDMNEDMPVIMMTAYSCVNQAVEALKTGAHDYLTKPFDLNEIIRVIRRALTERELRQQIKHLSSQIQGKGALKEMMGTSDQVQELESEVNSVANSDFSIFILGETGVGKELVARAIHHASRRAKAPFVPVDCGAIPETLLESELFGHEKGAFTGADRQKIGKVEAAQGGTLFLDEIANLPWGSQAKLLRVIQEKTIYRLGGVRPIRVNVRFIVATNLDLAAIDANGSFRRDLFYRLNEFTLRVPPLRERREDIIYLAKRFLHITNAELGKKVEKFTEAATEALRQYSWPGNVRQLRSCIRRAVLLAEDEITEKLLGIKLEPAMAAGPGSARKAEVISWQGGSLKEILQKSSVAIEREVLVQALKYAGGNKAKAARLLAIDYKTLHTKVKKYAIFANGGNDDEKEKA